MKKLHTNGHSVHRCSDNDRAINKAIEQAQRAILSAQHKKGYWCFELEADCTIPAEYIMMMHFMDEIDHKLQQKIAVYLRRKQNDEGGWPLFYGGETDLSCTVKAYYALKLAGDNIDEPHMAKAREVVLSMGGAAKANVFTRIALALFEQLPWRGVPFIPAEIMTFPKWFPLHLHKVSYWSRTVMVPLFILCSLRAAAKNPHDIGVEELFIIPPDEEKNYFKIRSGMNRFIFILERIGFRLSRFIPRRLRSHAIKKAEEWFTARLNGVDGLGAIFPAMVNAYEALDLLGYAENHPYRITAKKALQKLLVIKEDKAYCQPCVSPVWDTLLAAGAFEEADSSNAEYKEALTSAADWLIKNQLKREPGDWRNSRPELEGGGWPFQFRNNYYPDLDDTAFAAYVLQKIDPDNYKEYILRAARWLKGMQSSNGGFAAFDIDNTYYYLNEIPFADHGALLDPPTADVSARCLLIFGHLVNEYPEFRDPINRCINYLFKEQEDDGSWFGRWGTNYIYGTWSALTAFEAAGISSQDQRIQKAVAWLKKIQREDGGWGEDNRSYHDPKMRGHANHSTSFQTAWALLGLMAAGETNSKAVKRGIEFLISSREEEGLWEEPEFTAPGFPRVFYLKYHGYSKYFPLWALARFRREKTGTVKKASKNKIGIVVALPQELKTLGRFDLQKNSIIQYSESIIICLSGIGAQNAAKAASRLLNKGATALISWGTAAALTADLRSGSLAIPDKIVTVEQQNIKTDDTLRNEITNQISLNGSLVTAPLCETKTLLGDKGQKTALAERTHAKIADMESGAIARLASKHDIPFLAIRSISDSASMSVPHAVLNNLKGGTIHIPGLIREAVIRPKDWLPMISLMISFRKAQQSLSKTAKKVLPYLNRYPH